MPIEWKKPATRFKPGVILAKIDAARTVSGEGASFRGFDWEALLPALHSMMRMPPAAAGVDLSALVWRALTRARGALGPAEFLAAANAELSALLSKREEAYCLLTTLSMRPADLPRSITWSSARIRFLPSGFPERFAARDSLIASHGSGAAPSPPSYARVIVSVRAKSASAAVSLALRALDLHRALLCLMGNPRMQITFGKPSLEPINAVRLGAHHTLHRPEGKPAQDGIWFEPGWVPAKLFRFSEPAVAGRNLLWARRSIAASAHGELIADALVRFARALDEADASSAFLRLWSAVESLATPGVADHEKLARRCAFLFHEGEYHRQILEHLRERRNESVHAGERAEDDRILCFQLQIYFSELIWFHLRNARVFSSLAEANEFLDLPTRRPEIQRKMRLHRKALRFIG